MEIIIDKCAGLDIHQGTVVACLIIGDGTKKARKEVRTFSAVTRELIAMRDWLKENGCTHIGMESTGVYWMPVYQVLEGHFELIVGNAQHIANVPGRKTDVKDAEWIANLIRHGLIRKSFIPPQSLRDVRDLMRYRRSLVESRTSERNRLLKVLVIANIKLATVASDVFGASGKAMLRAIIQGEASPESLANLAKGTLRRKIKELKLALEGAIRDHHREMLRMQLDRLDRIDSDIAELENKIDSLLKNHSEEIELLVTIPGVDRITASTVLSEIGPEMSHFPRASNLASWAGLCPGNHESAGKRISGRTRKGNVHVKTVLVQAANVVARMKSGYLKDKFYRIKSRRGHKRAAIAIAHKMLTAAYHVLRDKKEYKDLGTNYLDQIDEIKTANRLKSRLERLGYEVMLGKKTE